MKTQKPKKIKVPMPKTLSQHAILPPGSPPKRRSKPFTGQRRASKNTY